ncbi:hypothetical protein C8Q75DRAFT_356634 [Abortiporus biennis]|nr:hypothetical protein C8Q75DRAFT_356634 [Abortiporus biennis]
MDSYGDNSASPQDSSPIGQASDELRSVPYASGSAALPIYEDKQRKGTKTKKTVTFGRILYYAFTNTPDEDEEEDEDDAEELNPTWRIEWDNENYLQAFPLEHRVTISPFDKDFSAVNKYSGSNIMVTTPEQQKFIWDAKKRLEEEERMSQTLPHIAEDDLSIAAETTSSPLSSSDSTDLLPPPPPYVESRGQLVKMGNHGVEVEPFPSLSRLGNATGNKTIRTTNTFFNSTRTKPRKPAPPPRPSIPPTLEAIVEDDSTDKRFQRAPPPYARSPSYSSRTLTKAERASAARTANALFTHFKPEEEKEIEEVSETLESHMDRLSSLFHNVELELGMEARGSVETTSQVASGNPRVVRSKSGGRGLLTAPIKPGVDTAVATPQAINRPSRSSTRSKELSTPPSLSSTGPSYSHRRLSRAQSISAARTATLLFSDFKSDEEGKISHISPFLRSRMDRSDVAMFSDEELEVETVGKVEYGSDTPVGAMEPAAQSSFTAQKDAKTAIVNSQATGSTSRRLSRSKRALSLIGSLSSTDALPKYTPQTVDSDKDLKGSTPLDAFDEKIAFVEEREEEFVKLVETDSRKDIAALFYAVRDFLEDNTKESEVSKTPAQYKRHVKPTPTSTPDSTITTIGRAGRKTGWGTIGSSPRTKVHETDIATATVGTQTSSKMEIEEETDVIPAEIDADTTSASVGSTSVLPAKKSKYEGISGLGLPSTLRARAPPSHRMFIHRFKPMEYDELI